MRWRVRPSVLHGSVELPGDKSIAHRALILAALARGRSRIENMPEGKAVAATAGCLHALGVEIRQHDGVAEIRSGGELIAASRDLYAGNSATTMRLLTGLLAGQSFPSRITGDRWLSQRPMQRVVEPLGLMGADIRSHDGKAPLDIRGSRLRSIRYTLPVASAQVKSAILLAGLFAEGETVVVEPAPTRDHTERLFQALGLDLLRRDGGVSIEAGQRPRAFSLVVPGDISSAAFFLAGAALTGGTVTARGVGLNPTRAAFLDVLQRMGAEVTVTNESDRTGEPAGDVTVSGRIEKAIEIGEAEVPLLVDELPVVALLATHARGLSSIRGAGELRVKETDRIAGVARILRSMGADLDELPDGFVIRGPKPLRGGQVTSGGDHRLAMLAAIGGTATHGDMYIDGAEAAAVSLPEFPGLFGAVGGLIDEA